MAMICLSDFEKKAAECLPQSSWGYYRSGAGDEFTLKLNRTAYNRLAKSINKNVFFCFQIHNWSKFIVGGFDPES